MESITLTDVHLNDETTAAYDLILDSDSDGTALTADRTLTFDVNNANRTIDLAGDLTLTGSNIVATWATTRTITATTANEYANTITITDATTASEDMHKGLQVAYACSGSKTGSAHVECIGGDLTITGNTPEAYAFAAYLTASNRDDTLGNVGGMDIYMEDMGDSVSNLWGLCIGINGTNKASSRHCGIEVRTHGGEIRDAILLTSAAVDGIDMSGSIISGSDIVLSNSATVKNTTSGLIELSAESKFAETVCFDAVQTATGDSTTTIDWGLGNLFYFTFGAFNETFTFTAPSGPARLVLWLKQDATGSRTATWPASVLWPGNVAPTLTTTAAAVDVVTLAYDGTNYFGLANLNFS